MAARTNADVLNGKETRTDQAHWGISVYTANMDNAIDRQDIHPLIPTNPHKLFRRAFLLEHHIRFPEGRRVLWEDVFFALDIAPHAKVVSVLADTPFYHWVRGPRTASSSYWERPEEYWHWVREIVQMTNEKLSGPTLEGQWRLMLLHQYRSRVLARLDTKLFKAPISRLSLPRRWPRTSSATTSLRSWTLVSARWISVKLRWCVVGDGISSRSWWPWTPA